MKIRFFGGANEIGASSTLIIIEGQRILVDAGTRMNVTPGKQLPDFSQLGKIDVVLITHAHTDHTGALPILIRDYLSKDVKVYATAATKAIVKVLLEDSARRLESEEQEPQYTLDDVALALSRIEKVPCNERIPICGGILTATWIPAGHILGAAMIYIEGKRENLLMTGDVSVTNQLTVPGVIEQLPSWLIKPDVMVMESTYGNRKHTNRAEQEAELVRDVAATIADGGKVLIPVFAVGRAQEVILILKRAMESGQISEFPVYVDGMVCKVNDIYKRFPDELSQDLKHSLQSSGDLFYSGSIRKVEPADKRSDILLGEPCCIIAASGMLKGGWSSYYAKRLAGNQENRIAFTGHQAEGNPGCKLLDDRVLNIEGQEANVECKVKKYSLSAHADRNELTQLVKKVQPRKVFLVHGNAEARNELKQSIQEESPTLHVELPQNGVSYRGTKRKGIAGIAEGRILSLNRILREVFELVKKVGWEGPFSVRELAEMWFGPDQTTPKEEKLFEGLLSPDRQTFFVQDRQFPDLFHLGQTV